MIEGIDMEFRNLYSFLRVAELGSFTKAAEELGYAQSSITTHIQQLELEIGTPLFEHVGRRVSLTAFGGQMLPYVNQILHLQEQILSLNQTDSTKVCGTLRIGIVESIMHTSLVSNMHEYRRRFPNVSIQVSPAVSAPLVEMLRNGEVDLIFTLSDKQTLPGCIYAGGFPTKAVFLAASDHPLVGRSDLTLSDVLQQPLILTRSNTFLQQFLEHEANKRGIDVQPIVETASNSFILSLIRQRIGISFLPEYLVRSPFFAGKVAELPVSDFELPFYVNMFYHKNKFVTPQMTGLIELMQEYWRQLPWTHTSLPDDADDNSAETLQ